jgi:cobalt-zinc-cadmium efflux system membrane fusion protein
VSKRPVAFPSTRAAACLMVIATLGAGCSSKPAADATADGARPATFKVTTEQRARLRLVTMAATAFRPTLEVTGTVAFDGDHSTQVLSPISGPVTRLLVNPGANVTAGQALATVASPDFASAVAGYRKAQEAARNTQRILSRDEQLFQNDALARSDLDQARADAASAAADLEAAGQQLRSLGVDEPVIAAIRDGRQASPVEGAIRSPIAGTVVEKLINPGQLLAAGATPAFTVADLATMWVLANVFERDLALVGAGNAVDIATDAQREPIHGRVDYVSAIVDPGTKATTVRIVADNRARALKRDMFVRANIHSSSAHSGLLVPSAALLHDDDNLPFVFIAMADGSFARRRVQVGFRVGDLYEITAGLKVGDQVVADGALFIQFAESQ